MADKVSVDLSKEMEGFNVLAEHALLTQRIIVASEMFAQSLTVPTLLNSGLLVGGDGIVLASTPKSLKAKGQNSMHAKPA